MISTAPCGGHAGGPMHTQPNVDSWGQFFTAMSRNTHAYLQVDRRHHGRRTRHHHRSRRQSHQVVRTTTRLDTKPGTAGEALDNRQPGRGCCTEEAVAEILGLALNRESGVCEDQPKELELKPQPWLRPAPGEEGPNARGAGRGEVTASIISVRQWIRGPTIPRHTAAHGPPFQHVITQRGPVDRCRLRQSHRKRTGQ